MSLMWGTNDHGPGHEVSSHRWMRALHCGSCKASSSWGHCSQCPASSLRLVASSRMIRPKAKTSVSRVYSGTDAVPFWPAVKCCSNHARQRHHGSCNTLSDSQPNTHHSLTSLAADLASPHATPLKSSACETSACCSEGASQRLPGHLPVWGHHHHQIAAAGRADRRSKVGSIHETCSCTVCLHGRPCAELVQTAQCMTCTACTACREGRAPAGKRRGRSVARPRSPILISPLWPLM